MTPTLFDQRILDNCTTTNIKEAFPYQNTSLDMYFMSVVIDSFVIMHALTEL